MHDPTKVLLGSVPSSAKTVTNRIGDIEAGVAVRLTSAGALSVASADGELLGISLGRDLSATNKTAIVRKGLRVPVLLGGGLEPVVGAVVHISNTTGLAVASGGGATAVNAVYASGVLTGLKEDGTTEAPCALVDMQGGL